MTQSSWLDNLFPKINKILDVTLYNAFKQFPNTIQASADYLVGGVNRAAALLVLGLEQKELKTGSINWHYLESKRGDADIEKETLLCLHGFSDDKFSFALTAKELRKEYHIISIDLPGFGDTDKPQIEKYLLDHYQAWVLEFIEAKGVTNCHIMGNSLGGAIAAGIAADYSEVFKSITLIGAAGVIGSEPVGIYKMIQEGDNVFAINDMKDFNCLLQDVFEKPPYIPFLIKHYRLRKFLVNKDWYDKLLKDLLEGILVKPLDRSGFLNEKIKKIKQPVLLVWGEEDKLSPPVLGKLFNELIKDSKFVLIPNTGHLPQLESPMILAKEFNHFVSERVS